MKVQYLLTIPQIHAISLLAHIDGICSACCIDATRRVVEYDITSEQHCMLDSLLSQTGVVIKDKPQWPSKGDTYYYIDADGNISNDQWSLRYDGTPFDIDAGRRDIGNIFKTREEAEFEMERLKVLDQLKNLSDDDKEWNRINQHYYIIYDFKLNEFDVWSNYSAKLPHTYWFKSTASARAAIKTIGEDRLKKYVFGIKEKEN